MVVVSRYGRPEDRRETRLNGSPRQAGYPGSLVASRCDAMVQLTTEVYLELLGATSLPSDPDIDGWLVALQLCARPSGTFFLGKRFDPGLVDLKFNNYRVQQRPRTS